MILFVVPSVLFAIDPITAKKPITMSGVYFSEIPHSAPAKSPPALKNLPNTPVIHKFPVPLPHKTRNEAINQIRGVIGLKAFPLVAESPVVPAQVILTPGAPISGKNYYTIWNGDNCPDLKVSRIRFSRNPGFLDFWFKTIPGKTYMLDLSVDSADSTGVRRPISFTGVFEGSVTPPENYHVIIGFTATGLKSFLRLGVSYSMSNDFMNFYSFEITQVN
jgi:hypothetical protein